MADNEEGTIRLFFLPKGYQGVQRKGAVSSSSVSLEKRGLQNDHFGEDYTLKESQAGKNW